MDIPVQPQGALPPVPPSRGFFLDLIAGPDGTPNEAAFYFLAVGTVFIAGTLFETIKTGHFPMLNFVGGATSLVAIYNASAGARARLGDRS